MAVPVKVIVDTRFAVSEAQIRYNTVSVRLSTIPFVLDLPLEEGYDISAVGPVGERIIRETSDNIAGVARLGLAAGSLIVGVKPNFNAAIVDKLILRMLSGAVGAPLEVSRK